LTLSFVPADFIFWTAGVQGGRDPDLPESATVQTDSELFIVILIIFVVFTDS